MRVRVMVRVGACECLLKDDLEQPRGALLVADVEIA